MRSDSLRPNSLVAVATHPTWIPAGKISARVLWTLRMVSVAAAAGGVVLLIGSGWLPGHGSDAVAYQAAAERLRSGLPLYPAMAPDAVEAYRYAPWFAFAWLPLSYLPFSVSSTLLTVASCLAVGYMTLVAFRLGGHAGFLLAILVAGGLGAAPGGNIETVMTGVLVWALPRRGGPLAIGVYASLKVYPILMVAGYVAERRWREMATAVAAAGLLWLPAVCFGLDHYITDPGNGGIALSAVSTPLWLIVTSALLGATVLLAWWRSRWTWLAAVASAFLVPTRIFLADPGYFLAVAGRLTRESS